MMSRLGALAPGHAPKLNFGYDHCALWGTLTLGTLLSGHSISLNATGFFVMGLLLSAVWTFGSASLQIYDPWKPRSRLDDLAMVSLLIMAPSLLLGIAKLFFPVLWTQVPRTGHFFMLLWPAIVLPRMLLFRRLSSREDPIDDVLIVGTGPMARETARHLEEEGPRRRVLGYLRLSKQPLVVPEARVLGAAEELERCLRTLPVGEVFVAVRPGQAGDPTRQVIAACEKFGIPFALPALSHPLGRSRPAMPNAVADGYLHFVTFESRPIQRAVKRLFDIVSSGAALFFLSPLLLGVAAIIKVTSRGPVFFKQERVGLHGRSFKMLKFRSMVVNAEALKAKLAAANEQTGPVFKIKNDPRITPIGRFIRKYSIDELPQLLNVLRGDMSVVGPRPPVPPEVAQYEPWQRRRLSVRPGLTCIWQVSGRNQISFEDWMYLDMQYIDHWSFRSDLALILKTVPVVITGRGAS